MRAVRAALPVLLLLAACHCPGHVSTPVEEIGNVTFAAAQMEISTESTQRITPDHSIRLPGNRANVTRRVEEIANVTFEAAQMEMSTERTQPITPDHSIRLPGNRGNLSTRVEEIGNITFAAALIDMSTENTPPITPGHSIRLPGNGVGTWKEISLSRPRGNNARYTDGERSSSNTFKASNMWITTLLVVWKSLSGIINIINPSR